VAAALLKTCARPTLKNQLRESSLVPFRQDMTNERQRGPGTEPEIVRDYRRSFASPAMAPTPFAQPSRDRLRVAARWAWHYQTLVALRDHLVQERQCPQAADKFDRDFIRALLAREADPLAAVNAAIERILRGEYGRCEASGLPISRERLRAAPWARRRCD
jgi:RNA polymerase-binding transcription factor DksA